jgi:hypothetical protein
MRSALLFSRLSPGRQFLLRVCQSTNYGYIQDLHVRDREPVVDPAPIVFADIKLDSDERARDEFNNADFIVCAEIVRLLALLDQINNGKISKLEVRAGIPRRIVYEHRISELGGVSPR